MRIVARFELGALWLGITGFSLLLLAVTFVSYPLVGRGMLSSLLFMFGLGGEGNVGAWWSGALFILAAVLALDRAADAGNPAAERRGCFALAGALALLSFDEIAWLHEFLMARSTLLLLPVGALGAGLVVYALVELRRARVPVRGLLLGFMLLATVPLQELIQISQQWPNQWVYGARALVEEGTEIAAALVLLAGSGGRALAGRGRAEMFASLAKYGALLSVLAVAALPMGVAAASRFGLTGVVNWVGVSLFLLAALLAVREGGTAGTAKAAWYLLASAGVNAVRPDWTPVVLDNAVSLRGVYFGALFLAAAWVLARGDSWSRRAPWLIAAAATWLAAVVLLRAPLIWSTWPPLIALLCFHGELAAAMRAGPAARDAAIAALGGSVAGIKAPRLAGPP